MTFEVRAAAPNSKRTFWGETCRSTVLAGRFHQAAGLGDGLARHDHAGQAGRALGGRHLGQGQAVTVGGHGAQLDLAALVDRVEIEAVQIVAGLFGRDRETGLVDQTDQLVGIDRDAARQAVRAHDREVAGRQHRQVEARTAGLDHQAGVIAAEAQRDVGAVGQLADDFIEGVGRRGDLAGDVDLSQALVDDLHVQIGRRERQRVASADSRMFDRIGMVLRRSTTLCTCPSAFRSAARSIVSFIGRSRSRERPRESLATPVENGPPTLSQSAEGERGRARHLRAPRL
jgi:hypothetical protein